ncbi:MAG TPA: S1C family serine protease [Stellaceae bacterium]|nr:S1C family serine protease [Stellaceae bacterium]
MAKKPDWEIPILGQPKPEDFAFDLDRALLSVVGLQANIPEDASTASILGTERSGSGVVIRESGLVLTIGYLIIEAESLWLSTADGRAIPGHVLAHDWETGFGLVQALGRLGVPALPLGRSSELAANDPVILAGGGRRQSVRASVIGKQEYAGYWEYLLEEAIFTAPAHPFWGGTGLIGRDGTLLGIGSLNVQQVTDRGAPRKINMVVPIDVLKPVLDELLTYGRRNRAARPWLGLYSAESDGKVVIAALTERGPAAAAGMRVGDVVWAVRDASVESLADFYRKVWASGAAGAEIPIEVLRDDRTVWVRVKSVDRQALLKSPRLQ